MLTFFCKPQVASFYSSLKQPYTKLCHRQNLDRQTYLWNNLRMFLLIRLYKLRKKYIAQLKYWCLKQLGGKKLWIDLFFFRLRYFSGEQFHICKLFHAFMVDSKTCEIFWCVKIFCMPFLVPIMTRHDFLKK